MTLLIKTSKTLPIVTACAVYTGVKAIGTVLVGISILITATFWRAFFLFTLILSIVGLKFVTP